MNGRSDQIRVRHDLDQRRTGVGQPLCDGAVEIPCLLELKQFRAKTRDMTVGAGACPTCRKPMTATKATAKFAPFCSQRCRTTDLGAWLSGDHRISRPILETDLDEGPGYPLSEETED